MNDVGCVHNPGIASPPQTRSVPPQRDQHGDVRQPEAVRYDRVELSDAVLRPDVAGRTDEADERRIAEIRSRIVDGTYLTPDKLEAAIEGLYRDITGSP